MRRRVLRRGEHTGSLRPPRDNIWRWQVAGKVITVAQRKGGSGKTTLAANLAVAAARAGWRVAAVDIDPQQSLSLWFAMRGEHAADATALLASQIKGWRVRDEVERLARSADLVLVDSPPHDETEARLAVRAADLVLVPVQPSPMDVWATRETLALAREEGRPALVVLNRVPPRARLTDSMRDALAELGGEIAAARIGNRVLFASALAEGRAAAEVEPRGAAAAEIAALAQEIFERLQGNRQSS